MKLFKIKITKPLWLQEMLKTGRLSKSFMPKTQIIKIQNGNIKKYVKYKATPLCIWLRKLPEVRKKIGKETYIFNPDKHEICKYVR